MLCEKLLANKTCVYYICQWLKRTNYKISSGGRLQNMLTVLYYYVCPFHPLVSSSGLFISLSSHSTISFHCNHTDPCLSSAFSVSLSISLHTFAWEFLRTYGSVKLIEGKEEDDEEEAFCFEGNVVWLEVTN